MGVSISFLSAERKLPNLESILKGRLFPVRRGLLFRDGENVDIRLDKDAPFDMYMLTIVTTDI